MVRDSTEAAQVGLQVGHEERGRDSFAGNVRDDEAETILPEVEEVVIIAADLAGLDANACVFHRGEGRKSLWEKTRLDAFRNFEFVGCAALRFLLCGGGAALRFHGVGEFVEAD